MRKNASKRSHTGGKVFFSVPPAAHAWLGAPEAAPILVPLP